MAMENNTFIHKERTVTFWPLFTFLSMLPLGSQVHKPDDKHR